jgi:hypothetical protein
VKLHGNQIESRNNARRGLTFNVWLWTELNNDQKDVKFKRYYCYPQAAYSSDSETFSFSYSSSYPKIYIKSDFANGRNMLLELFVVGYAE